MSSKSRGKLKGKEPEVKRLLDAQERVFLPERREAAKAYFDQANSHPKETFVELKGFGNTNHITRVVEDFLTATKPMKDVLYDLAYYHDNMPTIQMETRDGADTGKTVCKKTSYIAMRKYFC